ncbi:MAG: SdpI family protein [Flavobacterium sp.]|uniref:SdpI family protein n=1 Tax=Flavobacterium sp. TaxID=239 RepID=UPI0022C839B8|nr:SdpI family protein [Flavobacterium sp.]MCZ8197440.1 SdpI family protein [Flavobacterium sp.]
MFNLDNILFLPALTSIIFLIAGLVMYSFPPKKINYLYGYRTNSSMKSQERWDFAQKYSSIQMIKLALLMFVISLIFSFFKISENLNLIFGLIVLLIGVSFMFYKVEKAIKVNFPN